MAYYKEGDNNSTYSSSMSTYRPTNVDARNYSNSNSSSRILSGRRSDVDARNYSQSETGGSKIFSYRAASGGHATAKVFTNVLMWLMIFGVGFMLYKFLWPLISKWTHLLKPTVDTTITTNREDVLRHSKDKMSNGNTYMDAALWLYDALIGRAWFGIFTDVDEARVGGYMLTVLKSEFMQLETVYKKVKDEKYSGFGIFGSSGKTLSADLKSAFNSSEQQKYLSHLILL